MVGSISPARRQYISGIYCQLGDYMPPIPPFRGTISTTIDLKYVGMVWVPADMRPKSPTIQGLPRQIANSPLRARLLRAWSGRLPLQAFDTEWRCDGVLKLTANAHENRPETQKDFFFIFQPSIFWGELLISGSLFLFTVFFVDSTVIFSTLPIH